MGNQLAFPLTSKVVQRKGSPQYKVAAADMQGFRMDFEDAHSIELDLGR